MEGFLVAKLKALPLFFIVIYGEVVKYFKTMLFVVIIMIREIYIYAPDSINANKIDLLYAKKRDGARESGFVDVITELVQFLHHQKQNVKFEHLTILNTQIYYTYEDGYGIVVTSGKKRPAEKMMKVVEDVRNLLLTYKTTGKVKNYSIGGNFDIDIEELIAGILKVVFIGAGGVGKTTLRNLLYGKIPWKHIPTMSNEAHKDADNEIASYLGVKDSVVIWDVPGQERLRTLWTHSIRDADAIVIVTDSSLQNTLESAKFVRFCQENEPDATLVGIANKQDLPKALLPSRVEQILKIDTYSMVAIDPTERENLIKIIRKVIFGNGENHD